MKDSCSRSGDEEEIRLKPLSEQITPLIQRKDSAAAPGITAGVASGVSSLHGGGRPMSQDERSFFEPRFGTDFSGVRVHADNSAAKLSKSINARAFTLGRNIVFGAGQYKPYSGEGKRLMAHELTHVVQQNTTGNSVIQKAEIDDNPQFCRNLQDLTSMLDAHINQVLSSVSSIQDGAARVDAVYQQLGSGSPYSPIEEWAEHLPTTHQHRVAINATRYRDNENPFLLISGSPSGRRTGSGTVNPWILKGERTLGTLLKFGHLCIGSDKLGHFFQQGRDYFYISVTLGRGDDYARGFGEWLEGRMPANSAIAGWIEHMDDQDWPGFERLAFNRPFWEGVFGLSTTGVFSRGDLAANEAGMEFYKRVYASPNVTFSSRAYINGQWNERINPSCFGPTMARLVAVNDPEFLRRHGDEVRAAYRRYIRQANNTRQGISLSGQDELRATMRRLLAPYISRYTC
ncbi:MAG: DUF4157 domain-containing protein [Deltaproteobacteria bacterium]|nr:DUF4157 domain-containing protein [Deltaproteobacteria bacterium]